MISKKRKFLAHTLILEFLIFSLFHRIFLEVPLITSESLPWLRKACLDVTFGGFAMSTLREMILTRPRQRNELLEMFSTLSYHEPIASKGRSASAAVYDVREQVSLF